MVVHSQPVCPPHHTPSPFQFARFGMSASTELLSFHSSMKKLRVSIICVVTYNWGRGKGTGCGRVGVDTVILVVDVITLRLSRFWRCTKLVDVDPEMHKAKRNVLHGLIPF